MVALLVIGSAGGLDNSGAAGQAWLPIPPAESPLIQFPVTGGVGTPAVSADEYLRQGQELERSGRWADAVIFYEEALRRFPQESGASLSVSAIATACGCVAALAGR